MADAYPWRRLGRLVVVAALPFALGGFGCAASSLEDEDWQDDEHAEEASFPGGWAPPADVRSAAAGQYVRYDGPPAWSGGRGCGSGIRPGARMLGDYLKRAFDGVSSYGGYDCRPNTAMPSQLSVHGTGRAIDVFVPTLGGKADNTRGDAVANWLVRNAAAIGVQYIVWDRTSFTASRSGNKFRGYGGPHPHHDHLHVELTEDGGDARTPWFSSAGPVLRWSYAGPIAGMHCTQLDEPADPHTWADNFLCADRDYGLRWSYAGPIAGMRCVGIHEGADPHGWHDNFLCVPPDSPLQLAWSVAGPVPGKQCVKVDEPADPHTWFDNYLCH